MLESLLISSQYGPGAKRFKVDIFAFWSENFFSVIVPFSSFCDNASSSGLVFYSKNRQFLIVWFFGGYFLEGGFSLWVLVFHHRFLTRQVLVPFQAVPRFWLPFHVLGWLIRLIASREGVVQHSGACLLCLDRCLQTRFWHIH